MTCEIKKVGVIGAGVMGAGIAAHFANAGFEVVLLDIPAKEGDDRSAIARGAIEKMLKANPAPFMHKSFAKRITPGNIDDDLGLMGDCDWIVEAIIERLDLKQALYARLEKVRKDSTIISSNTSTIPLEMLVEGRNESFQKHFLITHFFNPPRYMRLLEMVKGPRTDKKAYDSVKACADVRLGKGVVECKDTPGFIANRIGIFWMQAAFNAAIDLGVPVEDADAISGRPMGIPKTATFALMDLVGIDLMPHLAKSMLDTLPQKDRYREIYRDSGLVKQMIETGYTGRKGKGGFYRLNTEGGRKQKEVIDLKSGEYHPEQKSGLESVKAGKDGLKALVEFDDIGGQYAWALLSEGLSYAASLAGEISDSIFAIDEAMKLGYNWKYGPFEMIDRMGVDYFADRLKTDGRPVPAILDQARGNSFYRVIDGTLHYMGLDGKYEAVRRPEGVLLLADIKRASEPVARTASAKLWDIGEGVLCAEFTGKMNAIDQEVMAIYHKASALIMKKPEYKALVVYNEGDNFSVGANLGLALFALNVALYDQLEQFIQVGQQTYKALKYAPFPVVGAPAGMALGGGCEILLHCDAVQAHAESYIGLVEAGVGLIPGWGGCKEMILRGQKAKKMPRGPMPAIAHAFQTIATAQVAKSAFEAQEMLFMSEKDGISFNRDRLLFDARKKALELAQDYQPPKPADEIRLPGPSARSGFMMAVRDMAKMGKATQHDQVVAAQLADTLAGGETDITETLTEDQLLDLERANFMKLVHTDGTLARIEHMLETGKPLRN